MTILVIAGGTASGKTTIAAELTLRFQATLLQHDRYYKDIPHPKGHNFDEPNALDNTLLAHHIALLKSGQPAPLPVYHFPTHRRLPKVETVHPTSLIIIEGILVMAIPEICSQADLTVFVDAPADIRLTRRIQRDVIARGRDVDGVIAQYLTTVRPMHERYVEPCKSKADIVLDGTIPIEESIDILMPYLNAPRSQSST